MSPAGATVLRDVLVASGAGVVDAVDAPPVPGLWQLIEVQDFMWTSCGSGRGSVLSYIMVCKCTSLHSSKEGAQKTHSQAETRASQGLVPN